MSIAEKLIKGGIELDNQEMKFILWLSLVQLYNAGEDIVDVDEHETFNVHEMLDALDCQLGVIP